MPRVGDIYSVPVGTDGVPNQTISSTKYNGFVHDVETDLNAIRPIVAGGTGANTAAGAVTALGALALTGGTMTGVLTIAGSGAGQHLTVSGDYGNGDQTIVNFFNTNAGDDDCTIIAIGNSFANAQAANIGFDEATDCLSQWIFGDAKGSGINLKAGGRVGIGTMAPSVQFHLSSTATPNPDLMFFVGGPNIANNGVMAMGIGKSFGTANESARLTYTYNTTASFLDITHFGDATGLRVLKGGTVEVGGPSTFGKLSVNFSSVSHYGVAVRNSNSANGAYFCVFEKGDAAVIGGITNNNNTGVTYATTSDRRLKEDEQPFTRARSIIDALQVWDFRWTETGRRSVGLFAQDAREVFEDAVVPPTEQSDVWMIDYSKFVPTIIADLQDVHARLAAIEAQLGIAPATPR